MLEQNYPTASLVRRLAALLYDAIVVIALYILAGFIIQALYAPFHQGEPIGEIPSPYLLILLFCICFFYYSHSWRRGGQTIGDRKSTRLNSSHVRISYAVFSL